MYPFSLNSIFQRTMSVNCSLRRFLLLLVLSSSLWLCILSAAIVTHLPGFNGALPFHLETGYVSVDEGTQADLFYYFVESERNPSEDPLIIWLTGGPGCSTLNGLAREIGPLRFKIAPYDGTIPTLVYNPYAWTKISNMLFLDWPALTGFSVLKNDEKYNGDDIRSSKEIYNFLKKWFLDHPYFLSNPFYVGGNSYGGKLAPIVACKIVEGIEAGQHPLINFKGYITSNPFTSSIIDFNSMVPHAHGMGILSDELFQDIQRSCHGENYKKPKTGPCNEQIKIFMDFMNELMINNFLSKKCEGESKRLESINAADADRSIIRQTSTHLRSPPSIPDIECTTYSGYLAYYWANHNDTRAALHIKKGTVNEWQLCNAEFPYEIDFVNSSIPYHHDLITRGYHVLVFSGDHDMGVPFLGTMEWIESLNVSIIQPWRSWHVNGQVGGYTVRYSNNVTFATVKGGGHIPSKDRNMEASAMFHRWISHKSL